MSAHYFRRAPPGASDYRTYADYTRPWPSNPDGGTRAYTYKMIDALRSIQARAARGICGAYNTTSMAVLNVKAFLLSIEQ